MTSRGDLLHRLATRSATFGLARTPTILVLALLIVQAGSRPNPQLPIRADSDSAAERSRLCRSSCEPTLRMPPVCGSDGVTYRSRCHLTLVACRGGDVTLRHQGQCVSSPAGSLCMQKRAEALQGRPGHSVPHNIYVPQCTDDGLYAETQCHRGSGHCWCVDDQGAAVFGTAVLRALPECSARKTRTSTKSRKHQRRKGKGKRRRGCGSRNKRIFSDNAMSLIKQQYQNKAHPRTGARAEENLEKTAAEWKFSKLDKDRDDQISRLEFRRLRNKRTRKQLQPGRCGRRFHRYCDTDSSRTLNRQEWLLCLGVNRDDISFRVFLALNEGQEGPAEGDSTNGSAEADAQMEPTSDRSKMFDMLLGEENTTEKSAEAEPSCLVDRRQALENQRLAELEGKITSFFIPSCTTDNKYSPLQCHNTTGAGYCWCADPDTGQSLRRNVKDQVPDCSKIRHHANSGSQARRRKSRGRRRMPRACRGPSRLQTFLRQLMDQLTTNMIGALQDGYQLPLDPGGKKSFEEKVAEWKFTVTDKNDNNVLDRREWKVLRHEFSQDPARRRCGRRLPRYCDADSDDKIDLTEWLVCMGAVEEERRVNRRPNPFEEYLISD